MPSQESDRNDKVETAIRSLIYRSARIADEQHYKEWLDLFTADAVYAAMTYENLHDQGLYLFKDDGLEAIKERAAFLMGFWRVARSKTLHSISNIEFTAVTEKAVTARSYFVIHRSGDMQPSILHACGEYRDVFAYEHGRWLFAERIVIVDSSVLPAEFTELL